MQGLTLTNAFLTRRYYARLKFMIYDRMSIYFGGDVGNFGGGIISKPARNHHNHHIYGQFIFAVIARSAEHP